MGFFKFILGLFAGEKEVSDDDLISFAEKKDAELVEALKLYLGGRNRLIGELANANPQRKNANQLALSLDAIPRFLQRMEQSLKTMLDTANKKRFEEIEKNMRTILSLFTNLQRQITGVMKNKNLPTTNQKLSATKSLVDNFAKEERPVLVNAFR